MPIFCLIKSGQLLAGCLAGWLDCWAVRCAAPMARGGHHHYLLPFPFVLFSPQLLSLCSFARLASNTGRWRPPEPAGGAGRHAGPHSPPHRRRWMLPHVMLNLLLFAFGSFQTVRVCTAPLHMHVIRRFGLSMYRLDSVITSI